MLRILTFLLVCCAHTVSWCMDVTLKATNTKCNGSADGLIEVYIAQAVPSFTVKLYDRPPAIKQRTLEVVTTNDTLITFASLSAKKYYISIVDGKNQYFSGEVVINEPEPLKYLGDSIVKNPSSESATDGIIKVKITGGVPPYSYKWGEAAGEQKTQHAGNLSYGVYKCIISDANNCGPLRPAVFLMKPKEQ